MFKEITDYIDVKTYDGYRLTSLIKIDQGIIQYMLTFSVGFSSCISDLCVVFKLRFCIRVLIHILSACFLFIPHRFPSYCYDDGWRDRKYKQRRGERWFREEFLVRWSELYIRWDRNSCQRNSPIKSGRRWRLDSHVSLEPITRCIYIDVIIPTGRGTRCPK
jgi:hypothetical protein